VDHAAEPDDRELVRAAQAGDRRALERVLHRHHENVYALCRRMTGNDADARDATQEALLAIVRGLARFDGRAAFSTWVYRVATNACLDELRRRSRRPDPVDHRERVEARTSAPTHDQQVVDRLAIDDALALLPDEFRAAVVLRDVNGLDYAEIAEVLAIPPGTVRSRIARGRAAMARRLGNPTGDASVPTEAP
jgi:RNA polymerase sigma-70 factor (ECF subfamily)